ncbi:protein phosphatase 2C and cyclic nucleotide-binding/kinase domain-containing protein isoform X1 [Arachis stenosperma]|uniref:protein phosphatase 2C and cyclic nucleotide-binding/kinase domain-containing protein isoform X1 n=1 Tax=Arachis stenosperma TaxID=217475 RepID=UPI0025ACF082|nr:protein phosphatase 2C and cyclic nucleotide-binding/kinase domain-containing protein isoform X1 [Arachis stenosperma]
MGCIYSRVCIGDNCVGGAAAASSINGDAIARPPRGTSSSEPDESSAAAAASPDGDFQVLNQLSLTRDPEAGIRRLARVSSQFLPPEGCKVAKVPAFSYELRYSFLSQRGYYPDALDKANQDSFCIHTPFGSSPNDHFFGVFDGHGEFGAQCSQFVKQKLCENLLRSAKFQNDAVEACHGAFLATNLQLHNDVLDDSMSGTTAITVLVRGRTIIVANSGDSRAVIGERRGKDLVAVDLSLDQTPFRADELERVKMCGARVLTLDQIEGLKDPEVQCWGNEEGDDDGDPPRLWVPNGMYPGTAFTRSIGDSIAETIGVVANPEIVVFELTKDHPFFVLASDGVFEFISSQTVVDMVAKFKDPRDACAAIVAESYRLWLQYETRTDDITIIIVHINGLTEPGVGQEKTYGESLRTPVPQVVEMTGSESPSTLGWNSRNQRVRHDLSRARLRAIENSLENGQAWVPPSSAHRKTWEEEAHIERALHDHFLFRKLTASQCNVLLDSMERVEVQPGDIIVKQGSEGDCFYVVGSGEFEVLATQEEKDGEVTKVLQRYTSEKLSCFGELALMYNKPLQASVRAVTKGTLWALRREDFRGILMSEFSNLSSLKLLRSVDLLSRLSILQLSQISDSLSEVSYASGQTIIDRSEVHGLYIIQKGQVKITFDADLLMNPNVCSLEPDLENVNDNAQSRIELSIEKQEGSYFGEWALLGEKVGPLSAVAVGDVVCVVLTKEKFESVVGSIQKISQEDRKSRHNSKELARNFDFSSVGKVQLSDLEWIKSVYSTDCSDIGLVKFGEAENLLTLKRFSKPKVKRLGKEAQVLKEKDMMKGVSSSACIPQVLCTSADSIYAGIVLNTLLACPLSSILSSPFGETAAQFCAASVVIALEDLHKNGVLYRGVSPDVVMLDQTGHIQLVDFRFGKKLAGERTFTICGMADSLAPEIVLGKGHSFPADWWALGVLIYFMLRGEMPFGSWRENELDTVAKIAKRKLHLPDTFNPDAVDIISKLLDVEETTRLGSQGTDSVKSHPWFNGVEWEGIRHRTFPAPPEIISRVAQYLEVHSEDCSGSLGSPLQEVEELNVPEWLEDW